MTRSIHTLLKAKKCDPYLQLDHFFVSYHAQKTVLSCSCSKPLIRSDHLPVKILLHVSSAKPGKHMHTCKQQSALHRKQPFRERTARPPIINRCKLRDVAVKRAFQQH
eukprot:2415158-Ditylum_brightwellii.AAC.1